MVFFYLRSIDTLISDIQKLLIGEGVKSLTSIPEFSGRLSKKIGNKLEEEHSGTLRLSNLGTPCSRKLWYSINTPQIGDSLDATTRLKFLYGDILEETILWLAREAGHLVEGEQDEVDLFGVKGHIDAIIDGVLVDVKSASSYSFSNFASHLLPSNDSFGYLTQLDTYLHAVPSERLGEKDCGAFLVVDKTLGKICLDKHPKSVVNYKAKINDTRKILGHHIPPPRGFEEEDFGKSGNKKLGVACSYCSFKRHCWDKLKGYSYSSGPVFLTRVVREPEVPRLF